MDTIMVGSVGDVVVAIMMTVVFAVQVSTILSISHGDGFEDSPPAQDWQNRKPGQP